MYFDYNMYYMTEKEEKHPNFKRKKKKILLNTSWFNIIMNLKKI